MSGSATRTDGPSPLRQALWPLGLAYGTVAALRNALFDAGLKRRHRLSVPVVSVGNLTVGGTGKTPTVAWLCRLATEHGKKPGVLARGYGRAPGAVLNDEGVLLQRRFEGLLQRQDPDRVAAGEELVNDGADWIVLDDGFQHRRLHRDVDLVCLDATMPFSNGHCLPAGDLREFRSGLRRADLLLLTRAGGLSPEQLAARAHRLREICGREVKTFACDHRPTDVVRQPDGEVLDIAMLEGRHVVLLSAIAKPQSFRKTAEALGSKVVAEAVFRDHHRFTNAEVQETAALAKRHDALLLTTEKDDARLMQHGVERHVLRIDLAFVGGAPRPEDLRL